MKKLFILFLLLWGGSAWAADTMYYSNYLKLRFNSGMSACTASVADGNSKSADYIYELLGYSGGQCRVKVSNKKTGAVVFANNPYDSITVSQVPSCPSGQVHQEGTTDGACGAPPPPECKTPAGQPVSWSAKSGHSASPNAETSDGTSGIPTSSPTCGVSGVPEPTDCWSEPASDGGKDFYCSWTGTSNGQSAPSGTPAGAGPKSSGATPTNMPPSKSPSGSCPAGTSQGGVSSDGMAVCVGSGTNPTGANGGAPTDARPTSSTTTKTTDAAGNKVTTTTGTRDNGDGSKTTTKTTETEGPDGSKSSTTTTTTGLTPGGKQGQPDKPDTDFCRQHPELNICRNSSVAGQCGQISCMGDAIQCATLRAAAAMQCAQEKDVEAVKQMPVKALGDQVLSGADPMKGQIDEAIKGKEVDLGAASLDQSGFLGGGSCLPDRSFPVMGKTVTMSFSAVCERIQPLRAAVMACAFIVAYLLVARSVLQS